MGLNRESCHHRDNVQEQDDVADKRVGGFVAEKDFEISPQELRQQPHSESEAHERAKETGFPRGCLQIGEECDRGTKQKSTLQKIAKRRESEAPWSEDRQQDMNEHDCTDDERPLADVLERRLPHVPIVGSLRGAILLLR